MRVCKSVCSSVTLEPEDPGYLSLVPSFPFSLNPKLAVLDKLTCQGVTPIVATSGFYVGALDLNSNPHVCTASTLIQ